MTRLIEILISLAIVAALMLLVGLVLPSSRFLSESVETNRKMTIVYDTLNSLRRFEDWHPLPLHDPRVDIELSGPASGVGATLTYSSDVQSVGDGSWEIIESVPGQSVKYAVENDRRGHNKTTEFILTPTGRGAVKRNVEIKQTWSVDYGWNLLGRYAGLYVSRHVGDDLERGLSRLTNMLATVPNIDYDVEGSRMRGMAQVDRPAEDLLVVQAGSIERNNEAIQTSMESNMEWINRTMEANDLVAAGPMRIITTEFGRENYTFDIVQPVRRAVDDEEEDGNGDNDESDENDESGNGEDATDAADEDMPETPEPDRMAPVVAAGEPLEIEIPEGAPVEYVQTEPTRAVMAYYTGYMAELDNVRNALRAWALTQGYEVQGRPYEVYKSGIEDSFTIDGEYEVYWTIK